METNESQLEEVRARVGDSFTVDTSDVACQRFGFSHDDRIKVRLSGDEGVVVGVAPLQFDAGCVPAGDDVLWVKLNGQKTVCFFPDPQIDFELLS